jgi:hypothetical protein
MTDRSTEELVEALAARARPVAPLPPPLRRAAAALVPLGAAGVLLVVAAGDARGLMARYSGREALMAAEMTAMAATAVLAILGAFMLSVPGRSPRWLIAPLPPLLAWLGASGVGCYRDLARFGPNGWTPEHGGDCLLFILGAGVPIGGLMLWRLSRARPIEPLPVALLGGLGAAALAALLLQFFHPFGLTAIDLAVHFAAVGLVVALAALVRRRTLAPA